jgi:hypothetical protein
MKYEYLQITCNFLNDCAQAMRIKSERGTGQISEILTLSEAIPERFRPVLLMEGWKNGRKPT